MLTISSENAKQIRQPFKILCTFASREDDIDLTFQTASTAGVAAIDPNISDTLDNPSITMKGIADLSGGGFAVDGTCEFYDSTKQGTDESGKVGIRLKPSGQLQTTVAAGSAITGITIAITRGSGTIEAGGKTYEAKRIVQIPVNGTEITLTIKANAGERLEIASITPGFTLAFTEETITQCTLDLEADLSLMEPSMPISSIELKAYCPIDMTEIVTNVGDGAPITYSAGYDGDMSEERKFYLSEAITTEQKVITIKGEDISAKLDEHTMPAIVEKVESNGARKYLFSKLRQAIVNAGIKDTDMQTETYTDTDGSTKKTGTIYWPEQTSRNRVAAIMNQAHAEDAFWPVFVDAGIPKLTYTKPTSKWTIYEKDCGDVQIQTDRNYNKISSSGDYGIISECSIGSNTTIETVETTKNSKYESSFTDPYYNVTVSAAKDKLITALNALWTATAKKSVVKGSKVTIKKLQEALTIKRPGIAGTLTPACSGRIWMVNGNGKTFPDINNIFDRSSVTGAFMWKGDPRMQPRDVFTWVRLDGSTWTCTIESIILEHAEGGTTANIKFRKGVV